jgi:hypothetical protein
MNLDEWGAIEVRGDPEIVSMKIHRIEAISVNHNTSRYME